MMTESHSGVHLHGDKPAGSGVYDLNLLITPDVFMFATMQEGAVLEVYEERFSAVAGQTIADRVAFLTGNHQLLHGQHGKVSIAILNQQFTLVPDAYYSAEKARDMLGFASGAADLKNVHVHRLHGMHFCFAADAELYSYLERTFSNAEIIHAGAVSISLFFVHHALRGADLFLNVCGSVTEIVAKKDGMLAFYNVFHTDSDEDILYYLMSAIGQLGFDPETVRLAVAADRPASNPLLQNTGRYIRHMSFVVPDPSVKLSGELAGIPHHSYFTLLNQHLCEL